MIDTAFWKSQRELWHSAGGMALEAVKGRVRGRD